MPEVFVSYRRADAGASGRVCDRLRQHFGDGAVFVDVAVVRPGDHFRQVIERNVQSSRVFIALIGPNWNSAILPNQERRLDDPEDLVRREITLALGTTGCRVIPVLVGGACLPDRSELPEAIQRLADYHCVEIRDQRFDVDVKDLLNAIEQVLGRWWRRRIPIAATLAIVAVVGVVGGTYLQLGRSPDPVPIDAVVVSTGDKSAETSDPRMVPIEGTAGPPPIPGTWFGQIPPRMAGVAATGYDKFAQEKFIEGQTYGLFSYYFTDTLMKGLGDTNRDDAISWREAISRIAPDVQEESSDSQSPVYEGAANAFSLFSASPLDESDTKPHGKVYATLVGLNQYRIKNAALSGPVNDVSRFKALLSDKSRLLARHAEIVTLVDGAASQAQIWDKVEWLINAPGPDDVVVFYYSGHMSTETEGNEGSKRSFKAIYPYDTHTVGKIYIKVPDLVATLARSKAKHIVIIVDA